MPSFDRKTFNAQAFGAYSETVPKKRLNQLIKANIFKRNEDISKALKTQTGSFYAVIPMYGRIGGEPDNYDGKTDISSEGMPTYERGVVAFGRAKGFTEKDFSYDITSGVDFMDQVAAQLQDYWDDKNEDTLISIIKGIFAMTSNGGLEFIKKHTFDITKNSIPKVAETTLNDALQQASGDKKSVYSLSIMNSAIATQLENSKLLKYLTYTTPVGFLIYVVFIFFFAYFYTFIQLKPEEFAKNLQENGGYIPGIRPGEETKKYIDKVLSRLTILGATFLVVIAGLPILFAKFTSLPTSVTIGGTGLLIVVGVALETYKQLEGSLLSRSYKRGYSRR